MNNLFWNAFSISEYASLSSSLRNQNNSLVLLSISELITWYIGCFHSDYVSYKILPTQNPGKISCKQALLLEMEHFSTEASNFRLNIGYSRPTACFSSMALSILHTYATKANINLNHTYPQNNFFVVLWPPNFLSVPTALFCLKCQNVWYSITSLHCFLTCLNSA